MGVFPIVLLTLARERRSRATYEKSAETLTDALPQHPADSGGTLTFSLPAGEAPLTLLTSELRCP